MPRWLGRKDCVAGKKVNAGSAEARTATEVRLQGIHRDALIDPDLLANEVNLMRYACKIDLTDSVPTPQNALVDPNQ